MTMERTLTGHQIEPVSERRELESQESCVQELMFELRANPAQTNPEIAAGFDGLLGVAESLPLTTTEFGFARNWITSARRFWKQGEAGAALYQVRQVCRKLRLWEVPPSVEPSRDLIGPQ
jgi:hypothetical protein